MMERLVDLASLSDGELLARLRRAGAEELSAGFDLLVRRHRNGLVSFLYRYVGDRRAAEDLTQEAFLRVFRKVGEYNPSARFSTWLYTIATNLAKDEFKRRSRHPASSLDADPEGGELPLPDPEGPMPEAALEAAERRADVARALRRLRDEDREILVLKNVQDLSYDEIGRVLKLPMGTVKSRISRARLAFQEVWKRLAGAR